MRKILFRGKRLDNGEWIEGYYAHYIRQGAPFIGHHNTLGTIMWYEVDPATIGQYTGLKDKNGKRIFEGDVFQYGFDEVAAVAVVKFGEFGFGSQFDMNQVGFYAEWNPRAMYYRTDLGFWVKQRDIEIIGNIHDNPELIGGGEDG